MALQIRRGTSTEVISNQFVPAEGELIYTTDTKRVFVGDGFTIGGVDITSSGGTGGALTTNLDLNNQDITGIGDISISGLIVTDSEFRGNLRGDVIGDLAGNVVGAVLGELEGSVFGAGSTLLIDGDKNLIVGDTIGSIVNEDGDYVLDNRQSLNPVFYGTVSGDVVGDITGTLYGEVIGANSAVLVNGETNILSNLVITIQENNISSVDNFINFKGLNDQTVVFEQNQGSPFINANTLLSPDIFQPAKINFIGSKTSFSNPDLASLGDYVGSLAFSINDPNGTNVPLSLITTKVDNNGTVDTEFATGKISFVTIGGTDISNRILNFLTFDSKGQLAVNQENAQATLDVNGFARLAVLSAAPTNISNGMIAIADGSGWDPLSNGKQSMVVRLSGTWIEIASAL